MYFALMGKLSARRQDLAQDKDKGFTLIELLVVVIIIGILAAIAIPVYLGVQNNAKDSGVKSDLTNAKTAVIAIQTNTGKLPTAGKLDPTNADLKAAGLTVGDNISAAGIILQPNAAGDAFCLYAANKQSTPTTFATSDAKGVDKGTCSAGAFVPVATTP
jgi:type IV pilus assembly protein PilA